MTIFMLSSFMPNDERQQKYRPIFFSSRYFQIICANIHIFRLHYVHNMNTESEQEKNGHAKQIPSFEAIYHDRGMDTSALVPCFYTHHLIEYAYYIYYMYFFSFIAINNLLLRERENTFVKVIIMWPYHISMRLLNNSAMCLS